MKIYNKKLTSHRWKENSPGIVRGQGGPAPRTRMLVPIDGLGVRSNDEMVSLTAHGMSTPTCQLNATSLSST